MKAQLPRNDGRRTRLTIVCSIVLLALALIATQVFLRQTSVGSPRFLRMTFTLWSGTVIVSLALLILATVLGRNLIKLYFDRRSGQVGSRFKSKLVHIFIGLSLLPALLLFFLAYGMINLSIEQWFSAPAEQMLQNSHAIAVQYYAETEQRARLFTQGIADSLGGPTVDGSGMTMQEKIGQLQRRYGLNNVRVFDVRGNPAAETGERVSSDESRAAIEQLVSGALHGQTGFQVERVTPRDAKREVVWAAATVRDPAGGIAGAVLTELLIPESVKFKAYSVMEAYDVYQNLERQKAKLRFNFVLILALSTLLIVFAFSWFAMYLAKRITVPLQALAEGSAEVAAGNLAHRVDCDATDEFEDVVASFNRMTSDLQENKARIEGAQDSLRQTNIELDERRRYTETILQTIATGVVSLDGGYRIRTINRAACQMLGVQTAAADLRLDEIVPGPACNTLRVLLHRAAVLGQMMRNIELELPGKTLQLATTVSPLFDSAGQHNGWVVALDDVTELLRVEKMTAWQEVARRLAHEIKNPLTPIRLSAERMLSRYGHLLSKHGNGPAPAGSELASFECLLRECVGVIIAEADSLKKLVDEFSRFARLPEVRLEETDLHKVLENTLSLYNGRVQDVKLEKSLAGDIPMLRLDPEQMKRVFINLLDNALEAMAHSSGPKEIHIRTSRNTPQRSVRVEIADTGPGFPKEYQDSIFLPYFSTRKGGTGLGLAIVRQIITDHHGLVRAEPNVPLGTRIVIDLPLASS